jgi:glycosyltransferase involved in cell wall biosynthesis
MRGAPVVHVVAYYPPHLGGMENVARAIAEALARTRHVDVLTTTCGAMGSPRIEHGGGLTIRRLRAREIANVPVAPGLFFQLLRISPHAVVHVHVAQALVPEMVWLARRLRRGGFVAHFHLDVAPHGRFGRCFIWYKKRVLGYTLRAASKVIALSQDQARFLERAYRVDPRAIAIVPNGVGAEFTPAPVMNDNGTCPFRVLYVGRLSPQKAVPRLVEALAKMRQPVQAVLVGDGDQRPMIESLLRQHSLSNVRLAGIRLGAELVQFYRWADVLVLPSDREGMPLVVLEAMACGLPVVATDVVGSRELLTDVGVLVQPDPASLALVLDKLAQDVPLRAELRARGLAAVREYTWDRLVHRIERVYAETASQ